ncbi:MAG: LuxR family transcriptional regulator [Leptolyngbya sp. PLA3]|nr:MAG: LuxR family transcriptional regulator [Cyanobacteria bacterium CYA]MCE7968308.1 LuxR family transcriptional regulator [Leptolyngbya sp. PL-A3]
MQGSTGGVSELLQQGRFESLFGAIERTPGLGVFLIDDEGRIEYLTRSAAEILFRCEVNGAIGRSLATLLGEHYGPGLLQRAQAGPLHAERLIWGGWQLILVFYCDGAAHGLHRACTVQRVADPIGDQWRGLKVHRADCADFGPLGVLSARELEVAAMIGAGMSVREIASHLHRSIKTIENHRISIGRKLGIGSRLEIALMANIAGLRPSDSELRRLGPETLRSR